MLIPDELQSEEDSVLARIRAGDGIDHYETVRQRKDGSRLSISLTVSPIRDEARRDRRRLEDRPRHHRAGAPAAAAREHAEITEQLSEVGAVVASTLDRDTIVQKVTDTATAADARPSSARSSTTCATPSPATPTCSTRCRARRRRRSRSFPHPRATAVFAPTFRGEATVRLDDVTADPRFGQNPPFHGMPPGHLPVRSYLAVPVRGMHGDVLGGLFFGSSRVGVFTGAARADCRRHRRVGGGRARERAAARRSAATPTA